MSPFQALIDDDQHGVQLLRKRDDFCLASIQICKQIRTPGILLEGNAQPSRSAQSRTPDSAWSASK